MDFETLRTERKALGEVVRLHAPSIRYFRHPDRCWFRFTAEEQARERGAPSIAHFSSTASCIESLADDPTLDLTGDSDFLQLVSEFTRRALEAPDERWSSEGAARVYCRVRTLPAILRFGPGEILAEQNDRIIELLSYVWERVRSNESDHQGVSEAPDIPDGGRGYPGNAFHTYWAIRCLVEYEKRNLLDLPRDIQQKRTVAELWTEKTLAAQTSLILSRAERIDANQLAWALATQFTHPPEPPLTSESAGRELYRAALEAFFSEQLPTGGWRLYQPLFHYPAAGNAYCYTFETLTELVRPALNRDHGSVLRDLLFPFVPKLLAAWRFASGTRLSLPDGVGWCSGHHPHRTSAEAWATASVFSFLQALRRLVAEWTSEAAEATLGVRAARWPTTEAAIEILRERGDTFTRKGDWTAGRRLAALFLHPIRAGERPRSVIDADTALIRTDQARSAILFGPPGTGKTTLAEALAGAIEWRFVEIHASDFLREGIDKVPRRADEIFAALMELDHCVILFDEIDELLRERQATDSDPFGRFLTTTMLPKLARLWEQRRVIFFVATNDIARADPAIKRSQRFDAAIFITPPSYQQKERALKRFLEVDRIPGMTWGAIAAALGGPMEGGDPLGVFALLRYDQVAELAERAKANSAGGPITELAIRKALEDMGVSLKETDWHHPDYTDPFELFRHYRNSERRDYRMIQLVSVQDPPSTPPPACAFFGDTTNRDHYLRLIGPLSLRDSVTQAGAWRLRSDGWEVRDDGLLRFRG